MGFPGVQMIGQVTPACVRAFTIFAVFAMIAAGAQLQVEEPPSPGEGAPEPFPIRTTVFTFTGNGTFPPCLVGTTEVKLCMFLNESPSDWTTLELRISPGTEPVGCAAVSGFETCTPQQGTNDTPSVLILAGGTGIQQGHILALSAPGPPWASLPTFVAIANVPEPASAALALSGLAVLLYVRRQIR